MNKLITVLLLAAVAACSGCVSSNFADFIAKQPGVTATDITQTTTTPIYAHQESASGISTDPVTGILTVTNGKATASIPELGVQWSLNVSGLKVQASPAQLAAAAPAAAAPLRTDIPVPVPLSIK